MCHGAGVADDIVRPDRLAFGDHGNIRARLELQLHGAKRGAERAARVAASHSLQHLRVVCSGL
jgi:hypothetical protein